MGRGLAKVEVGFTVSKRGNLKGRELGMGVRAARGPRGF